MFEDKETDRRHTAEMERIIHHDPPWSIRWGATLFLFIIFIVAGFSMIIRYPDTIEAKIKTVVCIDSLKGVYRLGVIVSLDDVYKIRSGQYIVINSKETDGHGSVICDGNVKGIILNYNGKKSVVMDLKIKSRNKKEILNIKNSASAKITSDNLSISYRIYNALILKKNFRQ